MKSKDTLTNWFFNRMSESMVSQAHGKLTFSEAARLIQPYKVRIDVMDKENKHTGPEYFATLILMDQKIIPFKQI